MKKSVLLAAIAAVWVLAACGGDSSSSTGGSGTVTPTPTPTPTPPPPPPPVAGVVQSAAIATVPGAWALQVLPDNNVLISQRTIPGLMSLVSPTGAVRQVTGVPAASGLLDVTLSPNFASTGLVYFSYVKEEPDAVRIGRGKDDPAWNPQTMVISRARLDVTMARLENVEEIFRQLPILTAVGGNHTGGRIAFSPDGQYVFITSGDRAEEQRYLFDLDNNLGKIVRLFVDGRVPMDNPFPTAPRPEIWSTGHRNHYGLAFDLTGQLWSSEMGPKGGDEFNLILPGLNYGWPAVSNGVHDDGGPIPDHQEGDGYEAPKISWTPVIAPAGMIFYRGDEFGDWKGDAIVTGLQSRGLVRVEVNGTQATEVQRIDLGTRIRDIAEGPGGSLYVITDSGELRKVSPVF